MKILADDRVLFELEGYLLKAIAFFEQKNSIELKMQERIQNQFKAVTSAYIFKFRKYWEPIVGKKELGDKEFIEFVTKQKGYQDFSTMMDEKKEKSRLRAEERKKGNEEIRKASKEATRVRLEAHRNTGKKK